MPVTYVGGFSSTAITSGSNIVIDTTGRLVVDSVNAIETTTTWFTDVTILGSVISDARAIVLDTLDGTDTGNGENTVFIGETGVVRGQTPNNSSIYFKGNKNQFTNFGQVISNDNAVEFESAAVDNVSFFENHGAIIANDSPLDINFVAGNDASANAYVFNSGIMTGQRDAGIEFFYGKLWLVNSGTIQSFDDEGVTSQLADVDIINEGTISGRDFGVSVLSGDLKLVNSGTISTSGTDAVRLVISGGVVAQLPPES